MNLPLDTDLKTIRAHISVLQRKTGAQRARMAMELSDAVRETCVAGIKERHPDYSPDKIKLVILRLSIGKDLFNQIAPKIKSGRVTISG